MTKAHTAFVLTLLFSSHLFADSYLQINLVSDIPGLAPVTDPNLKNPWGMSFSGTSPFWVSDQATGVSTLYNGAGAKQALTVTVPPMNPPSPPPIGPTGQVFANISGNFLLNGNPSTFIFDTLAGTVDAWNGGTSASIMASTPGAVYTGLALGNNGSGNFLYAANFASGGIDVFNSSFAPTALSGNFLDPILPAGYAPYNIQNINGNLYVEYARPGVGGAQTGAGLGVVSIFDLSGHFISELIRSGPLNAPWGITLAPSNFGAFSNDLLVGNFGDGRINAFDPVTGAFLGTLSDDSGNPIVNDGLWALAVRPTGGSGSDPNAVYFDAGINHEVNGLMGKITAVPEPSTAALTLVGAMGMMALKRLRMKAGS